MSDPEVLAARDSSIRSSRDAYRWAAAEELLAARHRSFEILRRGGVLGLDVTAGELSPRLVERYLDLKQPALLYPPPAPPPPPPATLPLAPTPRSPPPAPS